jgi:hypothetical protein
VAATPPGRDRPLARTASSLLALFAVLALAILIAVRVRVVPARPEWVWPLGIVPLTALVVAVRARATRLVAIAAAELVIAGLLHQLLTLIRAWRLE